MNKKNNRKGFTIVELVIVIAVIAILATVLVPTFGNVIDNAKMAAVKEEARALYTEYVSQSTDGNFARNIVVEIDEDFYVVEDGVVKTDSDGKPDSYETADEAAEALGVGAGEAYVVVKDTTKTADDATRPTVAPST